MNESKKIDELFSMSADVENEDSLAVFVNEFEVFLQEMKIPQKKKQLILINEDYKPYILNINC